MNFLDIFWNTWKVRTSISIQRKIENFILREENINKVNANMPQILNQLHENNFHFNAVLNKQRTLLKIEKELLIIATGLHLTTEEKEKLKIELLRAREFLNQK